MDNSGSKSEPPRPRGSDSTRRPAGGALGTSSVVLQFTSSPAEGAEGWGCVRAVSRDQQGGGAGLQELNGGNVSTQDRQASHGAQVAQQTPDSLFELR